MMGSMLRTTLARVACWSCLGGALLLQGCAVVTAPGFGFTAPGTRTSTTLGQ